LHRNILGLPGKSHKRANPAQHTELYAKRLKSQLDIPVQVPPSRKLPAHLCPVTGVALRAGKFRFLWL